MIGHLLVRLRRWLSLYWWGSPRRVVPEEVREMAGLQGSNLWNYAGRDQSRL